MTLDQAEEQKQSAAVTLSDMEIFIFPELMYALVLANMMSPRIWRWRDDPWFDGIERMKPYRRITRLKQYIMDHYVFNLDLDTWGLTTKQKELARFRDIVGEDTLARSNALFGYEGDKYYFDIDIRTHFGLDKYDGDVIPYWKTETVETMDAFRFKPGYTTGAGECVSLATLYAAALFIVARIPLRDIYLMATPLHSQNFVDLDDGVLTNTRRLVTKTMWFNGSALSAQARRALENERVTIVTHESGHVHTLYDQATIDPDRYEHFTHRMETFLSTPLNKELLGNFLRHTSEIQKCFQLRWPIHGTDHYVGAERVLAYEHGSPYRITDSTRAKLMADIDMEEFQHEPLRSRIVLNDLEEFVHGKSLDIHKDDDLHRLREQFASDCMNAEMAIESLRRFCHIEPQLPLAGDKTFQAAPGTLGITPDMTRDQLLDHLAGIRERHPVAELAFHAYRDLTQVDPNPFLIAAVGRNPVSVDATRAMSTEELARAVAGLADESIYDGPSRLAQPDEVWNFERGDGLEKAVLLANLLRARAPEAPMSLRVDEGKAILECEWMAYPFPTSKEWVHADYAIPGITL